MRVYNKSILINERKNIMIMSSVYALRFIKLTEHPLDVRKNTEKETKSARDN